MPLGSTSGGYLLKVGGALVVLIVTVGAIGGLIVTQSDSVISEDTKERQKQLAEVQQSNAQQWLQGMRRQANLTAQAQPIQAADDCVDSCDKIQQYLDRQLQTLPGEVVALYQVEFQGEKEAKIPTGAVRNGSFSNAVEGRFTAKERPWASADRGRQFVSAPFEFSADGRQVVAFGAQIPNVTTIAQVGGDKVVTRWDNPDQYILVVVDLRKVSEQFSATGGGHSMLVSNEGEVVLSTNDSLIGENAVERGYVDESTLNATGGVAYDANYEVNGHPHVSTTAPVSDYQGVVVTQMPRSEAFALKSTIQTLIIALVGTVLVIGGVTNGILGYTTVRDLRKLSGKAREVAEGNFEVDLETDRGDEVGETFRSVGQMRDSLQDRIQEAEQARQEAEQARTRAEDLAKHLHEKAQQYRETMQTAADGDLTQRLDPESDNEAMTEIAEEFNEMMDELEGTVAEINDFAVRVATASEEVTSGAEEVRSASQRVTESIQEISDGAETQNEKFQAVNKEMEGLSTTTEEIAASSNEVADLAEQTVEEGRAGREAARDAREGMDKIESESETAVEEIGRLEEEMQEVDELLTFIRDVANQTNMLALNANIEASRGGGGDDEGEGFGVVAQEIKELADETMEAAEDIESRLERIKDQTSRAADGVQGTSQRIAEHAEDIENAIESLDEIAEYAEETNTGVQEIKAATQQQAASTEEVVSMVESTARISQSTSEEAENVAAAAEEQTSALTQVSQNADELATEANKLAEAMDRFSVDSDASTEVFEVDLEPLDTVQEVPEDAGSDVPAEPED